MKKILLFLLLAVNNVCSGQLLNNSFENWTFTPEIGDLWVLNDWMHCNKPGSGPASFFGTYKDTIAQSGSFALTLSRWYANDYDIVKFKNECTTKPTFLNGFYKYSDNALTSGTMDTALISVYLTKYNSINQVADTIGAGNIELVTANNFTLFQCPIVYPQSNISPDSILIIIKPSKFGTGVGIPICLSSSYCSYLTVDNISLTSGTKTTEAENEKPFVVFPNPTSSNISIVGDILNLRMAIYNSLGALVWNKIANSEKENLDTNNFHRGIYFLVINGKVDKFVIE